MSATALLVNGLALGCLIFSAVRDRGRTLDALKVAGRSLLKLGPAVGMVILLIGGLLGFLPEGTVSRIIGSDGGFGSTLVVALFGAVMYMPALVAFPLAGSLLAEGASVTAITAFITTLTMVGAVTLPVEIRILGRKLALLRNGLSFVVALAIALLMGKILS